MSAYGDDPSLHGVVGGPGAELTFMCSAPDGAPCRTYPTCDCESWCCCDGEAGAHDPGEHCCSTTAQPGQPCWMQAHIDTDTEACGPSLYTGPGCQPARPGWHAVMVEWDGDGCTWEYADPAPASRSDRHGGKLL